jgi:glycosyltransferase involved in cell wall biosynthesis
LIQVAFDHQIFTSQRVGGISRQFCRLVEGLREYDVRAVFPFFLTNNLYLKESQCFPWQRRLERAGLRFSRRSVRRWNRRTQGPALRLRGFDLLHPTYYDDAFTPWLGGRPFVLSIVDMIPEFYPSSEVADSAKQKSSLIPRAAAILTNSETTRRDLLRFHALPPERVRVAELGAPSEAAPKGPRPSVPERYLLYVGGRHAYKNFDRFARAAAGLMRRHGDLSLVIAGGGALQEKEAQPFLERGCEARVHHLEPDDPELRWLYSEAAALVVPSEYEGFGLPLVEAFAFGCPVAASDTDALMEVSDGAALHFDRFDAGAMEQSIDRVLEDAELRRRLVSDGRRRAQCFSWQRMARTTAEAYRDVVSGALSG